MKSRIFIAIVSTFLTLTATNLYANEPKNLDLVREKLIQYHDTGEYQRDQTKVAHLALEYLKARLQHPAKKPMAIVLDIDETSLSNYPDLLKMNFSGNHEDEKKAEMEGKDPVIEPMLELYRFAKEHHVAVFFVTGRTESYREATIRNLEDAGFKNWDGLVFKSENYHEKSAAPYKINARADIENHGYDIVLSIGDQQSDLQGRHADKTFKMPNPYYRIP